MGFNSGFKGFNSDRGPQLLSAVAGSRSIMNLAAEYNRSDNCTNLSSTILTSPKGLLFPQVNYYATFYKTVKT